MSERSSTGKTICFTRCIDGDSLTIAIVSTTVLGYEILLLRILAIRYWSSFASVIISLAMLGFAASGVLLAVRAPLAVRAENKSTSPAVSPQQSWFPSWISLLSLAVSIPAAYFLSRAIPCSPLTVLWDRWQFFLAAVNYLALSLPFLCGGFIIGNFFYRSELAAGRVYCFNMLGSALGAGCSLLLMNWYPPEVLLLLACFPVTLTAWTAYPDVLKRMLCTTLMIGCLILISTADPFPEMSEYKSLSRILLLPDARIENIQHTPFGLVTVTKSRYLRYAPGLSLSYKGSIPQQKAIHTDGDSMTVACRMSEPKQMKDFFGAILGALPFQFHHRPRVLVSGAGGGFEVLNALANGACHVDALENNPAIIKVMDGPLDAYSGHLYQRPDVTLLQQESRSFTRNAPQLYDLIVLNPGGSPFVSAAGTSSHDPDYLLTKEALQDFLGILNPSGALVLNSWLHLPPREEIRTLTTAVAALQSMNGSPVGNHVIFARSLRVATLLVFRNPITRDHIEAVRDFSNEFSFDLIYYPGIDSSEVNRFNRIQGAPYQAMAATVCKANIPVQADDGRYRTMLKEHLYNIHPPADDRPYFSHSFKWSSLPVLLQATGPNVTAQIGWGYMFLLIALLQAIPLGILLMLIPLWLIRKKTRRQTGASKKYPRFSYCIFFSLIGAGFMFMEVAWIHQTARFLSHPIYAFALIITLVLACSGLGAYRQSRSPRKLRSVLFLIAVLIVAHVSVYRSALIYRSMLLFYLDLVVMMGAAFFMGMPFPAGLNSLKDSCPALTPWVWAVNGVASVLGALLAGVLALSHGLTASCLLGGMFYLAAALPPVEEKFK